MTRTTRRRLMCLLAAMPVAWPGWAAPQLSAALVVPRAPAAAQQALLTTISQLPDAHPRRRRYRLAVPFGTPLFPPDHLLRETPGQPYDAGLDAWLALPPGQRSHDILLLPDEDYYWRDGEAADYYAAQFLVHLTATGATTTLAIIQVHARRRLGKVFHLLGRTGPGYYWDIRPAAPAPTSAAVLAEDLVLWLGAARQIS